MPPKVPAASLLGVGARLSKDAEALRNARLMPKLPALGTEVSDTLNPAHKMTMSEALGMVGAEGKTMNLTQTDRSRVFGPNKGGSGFSGLQLTSEPHAQAKATWGVGKPSHVTKMLKLNTPDTIWSTFQGSPTQHMSNPVVVQRMLEEFAKGNPSPELISKINAILPEGLDIRDPRILENFKTFDDRKALAKALTMGGPLKGEQATKNAFRVIDEETDPLVKGSPTYAVGPRVFELDNTRMTRPDLNSAFPEIVGGTDYGVHFDPAPLEEFAPELVAKYAERKNKNNKLTPINHKDLTSNTPQIFIDEARLSRMQKAGYAAGGVAHMAGGGGGMAILGAVAKLKKEADQARMMRKLTTPIVKPDEHIVGMQHVLPPAIREANKAVFMAKSADPDRYYHGTRANIKAFHPKTSKATFLTKEPDFAGSFAMEQDMFDVANDIPSKNPNQIRDSNIMPLRVQTENPFDPDNVAHMRAFKMKLNELIKENPENPHLHELWNTYDSLMDKSNSYNVDNTWHVIEKPAVQNLIKELGHDAFYVTEGGNKNLGVYDPRKIKSDIGNRGTYDTMSHDVNEKDGGLIHG